jgi:hypothetical protein
MFATQQSLDEALGITTEDRELEFEELPTVVWDGISPLALYESETIFWNRVELDNFCLEAGVRAEELKLVHLEPLRVYEVSPAMICPEVPDVGLPAVVMAAIHRLNHLVKEVGPFGWLPVPVAALIIS